MQEKYLGKSDVIWTFCRDSDKLIKKIRTNPNYKEKFIILEQNILPSIVESRTIKNELNKWPNFVQRQDDHICEEFSSRESYEWEQSNLIVVGSQYVKESLVNLGVFPGKIVIVPYGVSVQEYRSNKYKSPYVDRPLRVLFLGQVGIRKGSQYLLSAAKKYSPHEAIFRFVGEIQIRSEIISQSPRNCEFIGTIPRDMVLNHLEWADVMVLPSLVEGSAMVTYEAILAGCSQIVSKASGSVLKDGIGGFVIDEVSVTTITNAIDLYIQQPELLVKHRNQLIHYHTIIDLQSYSKRIKQVAHRADKCSL